MDLGKYLGMPTLQKRINKDTFGEVLAKVSSRLSGWRSQSLSSAGRLTLIKSVLSSIPVHTMSTIMLPKSVLEGLDKASRAFLWGSTPVKRKQHLVAWDRICVPRSEGGLGIRRSQEMNKALLGKMGWRLLHDDSSLWAKVLRTKYGLRGIRENTWIVSQRPCSSTWRSVKLGLRDVVLNGLRWIVGDGRDVCFWSEKWLTNETIQARAKVELPNGAKEIKVRDLWINGRGWNVELISPFVMENVTMELAAVVIDNFTGARDRLSWGETSDGRFSVKSAYSLLVKDHKPKQNMAGFFDRVWRVVVPERVRMFLWLVGQQAIMTNAERHRRHLSDTNICPLCKGGEESILHVLRDCPSAAGIWNRVVPVRKRQEFFDESLFEWLYRNLGMDSMVERCPWSTLFAMIIWWNWKWRCGYVFGETGKCRDRVQFVRDIAAEAYRAHETVNGRSRIGVEVERMIAWKPPEDGWLKLNTDGASHGNPGLAAAGGVLRDASGRWCAGFALNIGVCSAQLAELWGVYYGLCMAWDRRASRIELEIDSKLVVEFLMAGIAESHPMSFLVRLCQGFITRDWIVRIAHVYREANRLADGLANHGFTLPFGFHLFDVVPDCVVTLVDEDARGNSIPRTIRF